MSETDSSSTPPTTSQSGERSWWPVLAPAAALVVGVILGGVLVGVAQDDGDPAGSPQPSESPTATDGVSPSEGDMVMVIPEQCLAAADTVEAAVDLADRAAGAISNFETDELRTLLRRLEELDKQARAQAEACQAVETGAPSP